MKSNDDWKTSDRFTKTKHRCFDHVDIAFDTIDEKERKKRSMSFSSDDARGEARMETETETKKTFEHTRCTMVNSSDEWSNLKSCIANRRCHRVWEEDHCYALFSSYFSDMFAINQQKKFSLSSEIVCVALLFVFRRASFDLEERRSELRCRGKVIRIPNENFNQEGRTNEKTQWAAIDPFLPPVAVWCVCMCVCVCY